MLGDVIEARGGATGLNICVRLLASGVEASIETGYEGGAAGEGGELADVKASNSGYDPLATDDLASLPVLNEPEVSLRGGGVG